MATLTEDYVSFEIAKLLKDKGFDVPLWFYYDQNEEIMLASWSGWEEDWNNCFINNKPSPFISAPTHQMAMKWLREEKDIFIEVEYINQKACGCTIIVQSTGDLIAKWNWDRFQYANENPLTGNTYEEAVEAALKYSLENLI